MILSKSLPSSNNHDAMVQRFQKAQLIFEKIANEYGVKNTQDLLLDMINVGYSVSESAEILETVLL